MSGETKGGPASVDMSKLAYEGGKFTTAFSYLAEAHTLKDLLTPGYFDSGRTQGLHRMSTIDFMCDGPDSYETGQILVTRVIVDEAHPRRGGFDVELVWSKSIEKVHPVDGADRTRMESADSKKEAA